MPGREGVGDMCGGSVVRNPAIPQTGLHSDFNRLREPKRGLRLALCHRRCYYEIMGVVCAERNSTNVRAFT